MNSPWKEFALVGIGALICFLFMNSCNKPIETLPPVTNTELEKKVDSLQGIIGIIQIERGESIAREMNLTQTILKHERTIKALSTRKFSDFERDEWIQSYRTKSE